MKTNAFQSECPKWMKKNIYSRIFFLSQDKIEKVWNNLQRRETFTKGQVFPYRVEFVNDEQLGPFKEGELNIHHGPFLSVHGVIGEISDTYRDLKYFYGSYILSFRLARPVRLEFFKREDHIELKIHSYLHPKFEPIWTLINNIFWRFSGITFLL
jgi:hypothetical protein